MKTTIEIAADLRAQNVKKIFEAIDGLYVSKKEFEYDEVADTILAMVERYSTGFVTDIAKRFQNMNRYFNRQTNKIMSDKQRWCVAFAFQKITDQNVADYTDFCNAQ